MKTPREYLAAACQVDPQNLHPELHSWIEPAEQAIAAALADAERYKNNLVGALRRSDSSTPQPAGAPDPMP
jgi:hypothetical protein